MNIFASTITGHDQVKPLLDGLWQRLQEVSDLAMRLDRTLLDEEDQNELDAIDRITHGYVVFVLEAGSSLETDSPVELHLLNEVAAAITSHCDDALTALSHVLRLQAGMKTIPAIRVH